MNVVRHKYIPGRGPKSGGKIAAIGKALAHMNYIVHRPGPDRKKGGRELFNERDDLDAKDMREAIKRLGGNRVVVHTLTLSPEINLVDKKAFTREIMDKLGQDKGRDLEWFGVEHNNTDHHHLHVVILGKDRNGTDVQIDMKDIDKIKEYGDRYLERYHPRELERSTKERKARQRGRSEERAPTRELTKEERIRDGLELPLMHKKIIREQLEPYSKWKRATPERNDDARIKVEKPYYEDTIEAAGHEWSKSNNLDELRALNEYLWDNNEERIPKEEYKKLSDWIKEKERQKTEPEDKRETIEAAGKEWSKANGLDELRNLNEYLRDNAAERIPKKDYKRLLDWIDEKERLKAAPGDERKVEKEKEPLRVEPGDERKVEKEKEPLRVEPGDERKAEKEKEPLRVEPDDKSKTEKDKLVEEIEYKGEKYGKQDSYKKLTELVKKSREDEEKIPFADYQKIRVWIEDADRARWSDALEKQLQLTHKKFERSKTMEQLKEQEGGRVINPVQEEVMRNPLFGLWMKFASLSNELVRSIPLDDRLRDPVKEGRDELEAGKKGIDQRELDRMAMPKAGMEPEQLQGLEKAEKKDRDNRERIEQDIEKNKVAKHEELKKQKRDREHREPDYDVFDPWGQY